MCNSTEKLSTNWLKQSPDKSDFSQNFMILKMTSKKKGFLIFSWKFMIFYQFVDNFSALWLWITGKI